MKGPISSINGPMEKRPGIVGHTHHPEFGKGKAGRSEVEGHLWYMASSKPIYNTKNKPRPPTQKKGKIHRMIIESQEYGQTVSSDI